MVGDVAKKAEEKVQEQMPLLKRIAKKMFYSSVENPEDMMGLVDNMRKNLLGDTRYGNDFKELRGYVRKGNTDKAVTEITQYLDKLGLDATNYADVDKDHYSALVSILDYMVTNKLVSDTKLAKKYSGALDQAEKAYNLKLDIEEKKANKEKAQKGAEKKAKANPADGFSTKRTK